MFRQQLITAKATGAPSAAESTTAPTQLSSQSIAVTAPAIATATAAAAATATATSSKRVKIKVESESDVVDLRFSQSSGDSVHDSPVKRGSNNQNPRRRTTSSFSSPTSDELAKLQDKITNAEHELQVS